MAFFNYHLMKNKRTLSPILEMDENLALNSVFSDQHVNLVSSQEKHIFVGSAKNNKYKGVNNKLSFRQKISCQNKESIDERDSLYKPKDVIQHNKRNLDTRGKISVKNHPKDTDTKQDLIIPKSSAIDSFKGESTLHEIRDILCEISKNATEKDREIVNKIKQDLKLELETPISNKYNTPMNKSTKNTGKLLKKGISYTNTVSQRSSRIKKQLSAIPKGTRKTTTLKDHVKSQDYISNNTDPSLNNIKISPDENKFEVQEIRSSNVISPKQSLPVHKYTGKKNNVERLDIVDTISGIDKTILFNKRDEQTQWSATVNKYCRNEPVTIKGRLSKTSVTRGIVIPTQRSGDLADSCKGDRNSIGDHRRREQNVEKIQNSGSDYKELDGSKNKVQGGRIEKDCAFLTETVKSSSKEETNTSPLGCQYKFNDFTCEDNTLNYNKSHGSICTSVIGDTENENNKHDLKFELKSKAKSDINKTGLKCDSFTNVQVKKLGEASKLMKFQKTGSEHGIMNKTLITKCHNSLEKKKVTKLTSPIDKSEKLTKEQVNATGNGLKNTKTSDNALRCRPDCERREIKPQEKAIATIKDSNKRNVNKSSTSPVQGTHGIGTKTSKVPRPQSSVSPDSIKTHETTTQNTQRRTNTETPRRQLGTNNAVSSNTLKTIKSTESKITPKTTKKIDNVTITKTCQSIPQRKIRSYNKPPSDKGITSIVKETCTDANRISIDCCTDKTTFSNDHCICPNPIPKSVLKDKQTTGSAPNENKNGTANRANRLRNVASIGKINSGEIDLLSDGQNKADDQKVQQTALSNLLELKSEKNISNDHEASSTNNLNFTSVYYKEDKSNEMSSSEKGNGNTRGLHNINKDNEQNVKDYECVASSVTRDTTVPESISRNNNSIMGTDIEVRTSARIIIPPKSESCNIGSLCLSKEINLDIESNDIYDQGIYDNTNTKDKGNSDLLLPNVISSDTNHSLVVEKGSSNELCCSNNQNMEYVDVDTVKNFYDVKTSTNTIRNSKMSVKQAEDGTKKAKPKKLLSPKISTKNFISDNKKSIAFSSDKSEKEKQNLASIKRTQSGESIPTTKSPNVTRSHKSGTQVKSGIPSRRFQSSSILRSDEHLNDIPNKESNTNLHRRKMSPKGRDEGITKGRKKDSYNITPNNRLNKSKDSPDCNTQTKIDGCQSVKKSTENLSSEKISTAKYKLSGKQLSTNKKSTASCPSNNTTSAVKCSDKKLSDNSIDKSAIKTENVRGKVSPSPSNNNEKSTKRTGIPVTQCKKQEIATPITIKETSTKTNMVGTKSKTIRRGPKDLSLSTIKRKSPMSSPTSACSSRSNSITSVTEDRLASFVSARKVSPNIKPIPTRCIPQPTKTKTLEIKRNLTPTQNRIEMPRTLRFKSPSASKSCTPSPTLSRSSRASSISSPLNERSRIHFPNSVRQKDIETKKTAPSQQKHRESKLAIPKAKTSNPTVDKNSSRKGDENKSKTVSKSKPGLNSKLPVTRLGKGNATTKSTKKSEQSTQIIESLESNSNSNSMKATEQDEDEQEAFDKDMKNREHLISYKNFNINEKILKTVCLSDKDDHVSTSNQFKEEALDLSKAQNIENITHPQVEEQVQDPLGKIESVLNVETVAPMDEIIHKNDVHSSTESVCSDQYWSASDGENTDVADNIDNSCNPQSDMEPPKQITDLDRNITGQGSKCIDIDTTSTKTCEMFENQVNEENCSQNALDIKSKADLLHNIDINCTTELNSERSTINFVKENISQLPNVDQNTSGELINTFLMLDSKDSDKAQYVSKDYEEILSENSNLEQNFNEGNDKLSVEVNNHATFECNGDLAENAVKVVNVKTESLSELNLMEQQINQSRLSLDYEDDPLNKQTEQKQTDYTDEPNVVFTASIEYSDGVFYSCEVLPTVEYYNTTIELDTYKGDFMKYNVAEINEVRTSSIQGYKQLELKTINQNEEVSKDQNIITREQNALVCTSDSSKIEINDINDNSNISYECKCEDSSDIVKKYDFPNNGVNVFEPVLTEIEYEHSADKVSQNTYSNFDSTDFESDSSDTMTTNVQHSPGSRRPRRIFSREERKLKYERSKCTQSSLSMRTNKHKISHSGEILYDKDKNCNDLQHRLPQKSQNEFENSDNESKFIPANASNDSEGCDFESRCTSKESSPIHKSKDHIKQNTDERSHKQVERNLNEEAIFTKIITNEPDIILSNSQSQDSELILSDESGLSSVKSSEDGNEHASHDVVKRNTWVSAQPRNRQAVNLDKVFHSYDGFSVTVECTLNLNDENNQSSGCSQQNGSKDGDYVSTCDVEETISICLDDIEAAEKSGDDLAPETVSKDVLSISPEITSSPDTISYLDTTMLSDTNTKDKTNTITHANFKCSTTTSKSLRYPSNTKTEEISKQLIENKTSNGGCDSLQTTPESQDHYLQLKGNVQLKNSTILHSCDAKQLKHDQNILKSAFAELDEKIVTRSANNAMPCVENDKSSKACSDETSEFCEGNNKSPADRKHLMLDLSANEKHNAEMCMTDNIKTSKKNKVRQNVRRLTTDVVQFADEKESVVIERRARSKSPSPTVCMLSSETEDDIENVGHYRKVSEICRTFLEKTKEQTPNSPAESGPSIAGFSHASKQMKWARVEGVWQRIPVDGSTCISKTVNRELPIGQTRRNRRSNESLAQWKNLVDKIQKVQKEKLETEESENHAHVDDSNIQVSPDKYSTSQSTKPKQPPKTLPKPKRFSKNDVSVGITGGSISKPAVNYDPNNISSQKDNEPKDHRLVESNKYFEQNANKQVQESVHIDKRGDKKHCQSSKTDIETEMVKSNKTDSRNEMLETKPVSNLKETKMSTTIDERNDAFGKDKETTNERSTGVSMGLEFKEIHKPSSKKDIKCLEIEVKSDTENKSSVDKTENASGQSETRNLSRKDLEEKTMFLKTNKDNVMRTITTPVKQELFPKEEDISSDIIAKVLKVMDSFSQNDNISDQVEFTIGSSDSSDKEDLYKSNRDYKSSRHQLQYERQDNGAQSYQHRQQMLLSEISELEERSHDDLLENSNKNTTNRTPSKAPPCSTPTSGGKRSPCTQRSKLPKSHSLPTTALSHPGSRILYRDGSFVIEPDFPVEVEDPEDTKSLDIENGNYNDYNSLGRDANHYKGYSKCKRSQSEADLFDVDCDDDIFIQNDGNLTVIENNNDESTSSPLPKNESSTRPSSVEENEVVMREPDKSKRGRLKKKSNFHARRSKSFRDFSDTEKPVVKLRRNLSFVEACDDKEKLNLSSRNGSLQSIDSSFSVDESPQHLRKMSLDDTRSKNQGFLQKVFSRRKGSIDINGKKRSESKESILRKMSLKTLFGAKKGKDNDKDSCDEPQTPPIAAFQSDNDIHIIDSAPGSPYSSLRFKRRHTSAEIYDQSATSSSRSSLDILSSRSRGSRLDELSMKSLNSSNLSIAEQPLRPKSPKPNVTIVRRNSNLSLPSSPTNEVIFDMGGKPIDSVHKKYDSVDAARLISGNNSHNSHTLPSQRPSKQFSGADLEKLASKLVQNDMTSSNSNDSGIQHDVSVHSSNESLKKRESYNCRCVPSSTYGQFGAIRIQIDKSCDCGLAYIARSSPVVQRCSSVPVLDIESDSSEDETSPDSAGVPRRRKSPSPRPERPKSEISVRWADLVDSTDISPIKRRESGESKPRPKSDLEENLQLFDEMYEEVFDDYLYFTGGSSLSPDMKPFGSNGSLQLMYSSLQSLDSLRKHETCEQKTNKRRMSTPHPIKTRLSTRVPPAKQQKRSSLVRSHSMPESLDKLHRRRKLHSAIGSSNLHDIYLRNFEDDSSSDDGSDISVDHISLNEKSLSARSSRAQLSTLDEMPESETRTYAEALWDHITMDPEELRFRAGDLIEVIDMNDKDWWYGALDDHQEGWLPATFVRLRVNQDHFHEDIVSRLSEIPESSSPNLHRMSMINPDQGRTNVIKEILQAEQDYVKHMKDVVEGYIRHARKRVDMFTDEKITVIFGNIEEIFKFSTQFLETLENAYCKEQPHQSELGKCFLKHSKEFEIYSDYCNNHPSGSAELKDLYRKQKYRHFFEACRLLQEMIEIPLEGFLLNPVQKICKYPLQLAELLKYTPSSHPDYHSVQQALEAMKKIAALINERKRKMESIEKLARWQHTVEDWQGKDLLEKSSELIYSSEINKINSAGWSQERMFYLFDHQLVYCKKDLLKRNGFSYKGRIDMDHCDVIDIEDGKDNQYNVTVKNAWKLHETHKDKWYLLYAKSAGEKQRWIKSFQKERERVREDQENNFVPDHWKRTVLNRIKAAQEKNSRTVSEIQYKQEFIRGIPSHATLPRSYSKKQTKKRGWFPFGNKQKTKT